MTRRNGCFLLISLFITLLIAESASAITISAPQANEKVLTYSIWLNFTAPANDACQYVLCKSKETLSTIAVNGEGWIVKLGQKSLEMSETLDSGTASARQENIRNVTTFIGDDELPTLLKDGTFSNTQGNYDYRQYIYFDNNPPRADPGPMLSVVYAEDPDTSKAGDYLFIDYQSGNVIARYALEFVEPAKTDVTDSSGTVSTTGTYLWNFEGKNIKMLGKDWTIVKARTDSTNHSEVDLTLMTGVSKDTLNEGDSKTYTLNSKGYEVTIDFVGSTTTKITINGEVTDSLSKGDIQTLKDGTHIGIKDIIAQEFAGGVRKVEFYLGADKAGLRDTNTVQTGASGEQTLEFGTETITGTKVTIIGANTTNSYNLSSIQINITATEDEYVPIGGNLSKQLRRPQALLNSWDIEYAGLKPARIEKIRIKPAGDNQYNLEFADSYGNQASVPIAHATGGSGFKIGNNEGSLILSENQTINTGDYFVVSNPNQKQGERLTYAFKYINATKNASTESRDQHKITLLDMGAGRIVRERLTVPFAEDVNGLVNAPAKIVLTAFLPANTGVTNLTFRIWAATSPENDDFSIRVDLDGDGTLDAGLGSGLLQPYGGQIVNVTTKYGAQILFMGSPPNSTANSSIQPTGLKISIQTVDAGDYNSIQPTPVTFSMNASDGKLHIFEDTTTYGNLKYISPQNETNTSYAYTSLGTKVKWEKKPNEADRVEVDYPKTQRIPYVIIATPSTKVIWNNDTTTESCEPAKDIKATGTSKRSKRITGYSNTIDSETIAEKYILKVTCNDNTGATSQNSVQFSVNISDADNDGFSDVEDNCKLNANPDQRDTDGDGAGNWCDLDDDGDGINDTEDKLLGDATKINTSTITPYLEINNSPNLTKLFNDAYETRIKHGNKTLVEFVYNFSIGMLDLRNITVDRLNSTRGTTIVNMKGLTIVGAKTIYVDNINNRTTLCIRDAETYSETQISDLCNGADEFGISCPGTASGGKYNCTFTDNTNLTFKITGLEHSGVRQQPYCGDGSTDSGETCSNCPADAGACPQASTPSSGSGGGGGGGGGGGLPKAKRNETKNATQTPRNITEESKTSLVEAAPKPEPATTLNLTHAVSKAKKPSFGGITGFVTALPEVVRSPAVAAIIALTFLAGIYIGRNIRKSRSNTVKILIRPKQPT